MKTRLKERIAQTERALRQYAAKGDNPQKQIYAAMDYSLFAGGKRLRPVLMIECCTVCGGEPEAVLPFACAMEMIHTYSLIHDDLPAMDNDDFRRGRPTNHKQFGEGTAILAGDALLNRAFEITSDYRYPGVSAERVLRAMQLLARSSGTEGMIGGQVADLESENRKISLDELRYIHSLKTGAIIRSACTIGAVLAGGSEQQIQALDEYALNLGIAFQIQDDILDVTGTAEELGKPIGSDVQQGKNTYVSLCGLKRAEELGAFYTQKAIDSLACFGKEADFLRWLTITLTTRRS